MKYSKKYIFKWRQITAKKIVKRESFPFDLKPLSRILSFMMEKKTACWRFSIFIYTLFHSSLSCERQRWWLSTYKNNNRKLRWFKKEEQLTQIPSRLKEWKLLNGTKLFTSTKYFTSIYSWWHAFWWPIYTVCMLELHICFIISISFIGQSFCPRVRFKWICGKCVYVALHKATDHPPRQISYINFNDTAMFLLNNIRGILTFHAVKKQHCFHRKSPTLHACFHTNVL